MFVKLSLIVGQLIFIKYLIAFTVISSLCSSCNFTFGDESVNLKTLKLVQVLFRHGDKEPDRTYPGGVGALTNTGKKQLYNLGLYLRSRYKGHVDTKYIPTETQIISSERDRTILSAAMVAYGIYKKFNLAATWNGVGENKTNFEPIPIRPIPAELDRMLIPEKGCPRRVEINDRVRALKTREYLEKNRKLIEFYAENVGERGQQLLNESRPILDICQDLYIQIQDLIYQGNHNDSLPEWTGPLFESETFLGFDFSIIRGLVEDPEGKRLHGGTFMNHLITNMENIISGSDQVKLRLYSGHDQTIVFLLNLFGVDDPRVHREPPFGTAVMMELHENRWGKPFLKIWYRNQTESEPFLMTPPKCRHPCTTEKLRKIMRDFIPKDFELECRAQNTIQNQNQLLTSPGGHLGQAANNKKPEGDWQIVTWSILGAVSILLIVLTVTITSRHETVQLGDQFRNISNYSVNCLQMQNQN